MIPNSFKHVKSPMMRIQLGGAYEQDTALVPL
ncbi:MAG: hypothetical protein K0R67_3628 [Paenibacillus sp.]|nr:hypothetical protein [Paenibacillus sp.]